MRKNSARMEGNMSKKISRGMVICMVLSMLCSCFLSNNVLAYSNTETDEIILKQEDDIENLDGLCLDLSNDNIVPDKNGDVTIPIQDTYTTEENNNLSRISSISGRLKFTITNLSDFSDVSGVKPMHRPIQNFYATSQYIYVTQVYNGNNVKLSRCEITSSNSATYKDSMNLEHVGHGQTLVPYTRTDNGVTNHYFLVCANANEEYNEANEIGRIKYVATQSLKNTQINSLSNVAYSNSNKSKFANLRRCAINLSTDGENMILFKQSTSGNVQYSYYDFNTVHDVLNSNNSEKKDFQKSTTLSDACFYVINRSNLPLSQLQGIDIDDDLNVYIVCDGNNTVEKQAVLSVIFWDTETTKNYNLSWKLSEDLEIEGIQVRTDKIYIGAAPYNDVGRSKAYIFSIDKSDVVK